MIKTIAMGTTAFLALAAPSKCAAPSNNHHGANASTQRVCDDIGDANHTGDLRDRSHQVAIEIDGAKTGVAQGVRNAIDAFYGNPTATGAVLLDACTNAGAPE